MKRVIGLIDYRKALTAFVLLLVMLLFIPVAMGEEPEIFTSGNYQYSLLDDGTISIKKYTGKEDTLEIPYSIDGYIVTTIGDRAFSYCDSLTSITIPDSVTSIGDRAFSYCVSLTSITIPDSVNNIGANPWARCINSQTIKVSPDHPVLAVIDGVLYSKPDKRLICYPCSYTQSSFTIPKGIKIIGDSAFYFCDSLTSITISDSVTSIGDSAFSSCDSLTSITIPDSVTSIGDSAFYLCYSLTSIIVGRDSYARQYCIDHNLPYTYADANSWLND